VPIDTAGDTAQSDFPHGLLNFCTMGKNASRKRGLDHHAQNAATI
jgi:hypothetical protein